MDDGLNYSVDARIRVALSARAARASTAAASLVPTCGEDGCSHGQLAVIAAALADTAAETLTFAIACERRRGASWECLAEILGEDVAAVRKRFEVPVAYLERRLVEAWIDPEQTSRLPEGADDPGGCAARLDEWLTGGARLDEVLRHHPDSKVRDHPVSSGLGIMSLTEHRDLLAAAGRLVAGRDKADRQRSELGLHRRRIALLEWLLAEELNDPGTMGDLDEESLRTLLRAAQRASEQVRADPGHLRPDPG